jgi:archaellum component FlaF (FlaF/FlaG flagellin family)
MSVDDQIVYTSEIDPLTGEVVPKPMIVTGQLSDELGVNLTDRSIRVNYEMVNGQTGPVACQSGTTNMDGFFAITCPLSDVMAGKAKVSVSYSAYDNNDAYRYENKTVQTEFDVFSNSTLQITEIGPFKSSVDQWVAPNGSRYPVLYLKESFHIDAFLAQSNGQAVGGKCLNIYLDRDENVRPLATVRTSDIDGTVEWFSGDPTQNPTLRGVETTGGKLEGFRTLRVAFEPDRNIPGGCDKDSSNALNGSAMEVDVLVRSRVDLQVKQTWSNSGENGADEGDLITGEIALLRDRLDLAVENEEVIFAYEFFDTETGQWVVSDLNNKTRTNEQGAASFEWSFIGQSCDGNPCTGEWRITAYYPGSTYFAPSQDNITHEITYKKAEALGSSNDLLSPGNLVAFAVLLMALLIAGAIYYQRVQQQRQVQALRGILTDAMMQLEASNEYIAAIFDCYKSLVKHFRKYGFMKKVYETAREFEAAVRSAFNMVPVDQLDNFLSIFEEARYSEHTIDATHRDRAMQTLGAITNSLTMSLGEESVVKRIDASSIYDNLTKAGEFVAADGSVRQAGIVEGEGTDFKI